jgi:hypothetical protein
LEARPEILVALLSSFAEAIAAVYGAVVAGLERNLAGYSTLGADGLKHFSLSSTRVGLAGITAGFATLRLVGESFFGVKFLFVSRKNEFGSAFLAGQCFVAVHSNTSFLIL